MHTRRSEILYNTIFQFCCTVWGIGKRVRGTADSFFHLASRDCSYNRNSRKATFVVAVTEILKLPLEIDRLSLQLPLSKLARITRIQMSVWYGFIDITVYVDVNHFIGNLIKSYFNKFACERISQFRLADSAVSLWEYSSSYKTD